MKKSFVFITILSLLFSLIGCSNDSAPLTGSIKVSVNDSASRTITSAVSPKAVKYMVEGTAPDGSPVSFELSESTPSWTNAEAAPGNWSFTATAYNADGKAIGDGSSSATVVPGQSTSASIEVHEYSGMGRITVNLTGITSDRDSYTSTIYKMTAGNMTVVASGEFDTTGIVSFTLPNGFYALVLSCDNASINMPAAEAVRIMKDDNLSVSYSFCDQSGVEVVISNGIKPCPEMSVTLSRESIHVGEEVTATVSITPGTYKYVWYVNHVMIESVNENSANITFADEGVYKITCIAYDAETGVVWSQVATVNVIIPLMNTVSFYSGNRLIETRECPSSSTQSFPSIELGNGFTLKGWKAEGSDTLILDDSFSLPYSETEYKYYAYIDTELLTIVDTGAVYGTYYLENNSRITEIFIPDSIRGKEVTSIGYRAFNSLLSLTGITIPDSVTSIGEYAFGGCSNLASINIPDAVTSIGRHAFHGCYNLASINIPDAVTSIGDGAFQDCSSLTSIIIPDSVTSIGGWAFDGCSSLISINIPNFVTSIGYATFDDCSSLTSITIPASVTSIGEWAFADCSSLTSITIPASVTSIRQGAFYGCSSLTSINIKQNQQTTSLTGAPWGAPSSTEVNWQGEL
ncbi:leucine-rich repeat protein [Bullifex porci]|uniref:leucine-rich repeat protein n=1 Tax=Bullifex porci TaxID=2606638 RepID=UPI0023F07FDA|nr:leucine-rich repeat protein [Bullifex porci]MDD7254416.1 leucine-rich repeat protein [Bullifex porci]